MFIEGSKILLYSIVVSVIINLVLPQILLPFATPEEKKPPNGPALLSFKQKFMHMFVHHAQVPIIYNYSNYCFNICIGFNIFVKFILINIINFF